MPSIEYNLNIVKRLAEKLQANVMLKPSWNKTRDMCTAVYIVEMTGHIPVLVNDNYVALVQMEVVVIEDGVALELSPLLPSGKVPEELQAAPHMAMAIIQRSKPEFKPETHCRVRIPDGCVPAVEHMLNYVNSRNMKSVLRMYDQREITVGQYVSTEYGTETGQLEALETAVESLLDTMQAYAGPLYGAIVDGRPPEEWTPAMFDDPDPVARRALKRISKYPNLPARIRDDIQALLDNTAMTAEEFEAESQACVGGVIQWMRRIKASRMPEGAYRNPDPERIVKDAVEQMDKETAEERSRSGHDDHVAAEAVAAEDVASTTSDDSTVIRYTIGETKGDRNETDN